MAKNKYDFIQDLLQYKKLSIKQRESILHLIAFELKNEKINDDELCLRLDRIENQLGLSKSNLIPSQNENNTIKNITDFTDHDELINEFSDNFTIDAINSENALNQLFQINQLKKIEIAANPKHVADFMSLFNNRDGLKYLTHDFDEKDNFDIASFLAKAKKTFEEKTKEFSIPKSLWRIVEQFAFSSEPNWTAISERYINKPILTGWQNWAKDGRNIFHPWRNEHYKTIINDFRRVTRIESSPGKDKPNLETLIDKCIQFGLKGDSKDYEIEKLDLAKADFYTHVGNLKIAFVTIFEEIKKWSNSEDKKKITIKYEREPADNYFIRKVIITHLNSYPTKELQVLLKEWQQKGNMGKIHEKLNGYCHWSVETKIEDKPVKINILKEKNTPDYEEIGSAFGFSHILTFYYK